MFKQIKLTLLGINLTETQRKASGDSYQVETFWLSWEMSRCIIYVMLPSIHMYQQNSLQLYVPAVMYLVHTCTPMHTFPTPGAHFRAPGISFAAPI